MAALSTATKWIEMCGVLRLLQSAVPVHGRLDVNVALNRPSYKCSAFADTWGSYPPSQANDGNRDPVLQKVPNSCVHTSAQLHPWYAVDLGVPLSVHGVEFTNRAEMPWATHSNNFIIGMTDVSPTVSAPTLWNYHVCGQYPGVVPASATVYLQCASNMPPLRYVIAQFPINNFLCFCEFQVFIRRWKWSRTIGKKMINKVSSTLTVERRVDCMTNCTMSATCDSYNYRESDRTCQLNTHDTPLIANTGDIVTDNNWTWSSPNFVTVV